MASADDIFPQATCCEICGVALGDEVVIQEFADGSLVRLCPECAAGADLGQQPADRASDGPIAWPDTPPPEASSSPAETDPLEKTRELLLPVVDLISLQREMQGALERLAASLERFALEMISDSQDKSAVEGRLEMLELELDKTRSKLAEAESLLGTAVPAEATIPAAGATPTTGAAPAAAATLANGAAVSGLSAAQAAWNRPVMGPTEAPAAEGSGAPVASTPVAGAPQPAGGTVQVPATAPGKPGQAPVFQIGEVQAAQRYFNESPFIDRVRDVRRSLGRPKANVSRFPTPEPLALVTITWDIVWYQYLVDLRRDFSTNAERVSLYREGMDLDELAFEYREKNAVINDDGRLDASELEVKLLSDPSTLITEMVPGDAGLAEDATEEVWDHKISPEFKWDD